MKHELMTGLAKVQAMRKQCLDARDKIQDAKHEMFDDVQSKVEIYARMAERGRPGADYAYANLLKNRAMLHG